MKFNVVTIFPDLINDFINHGLVSKALAKNILEVQTWNPRNFSDNHSGRIDDKPFGGGQSMLLQAEPLIKTIDEIKEHNDTHVVFVAPHGKVFNQNKAHELKDKKNITIICGRYEGIDQRVIDNYVDEEVSIGDFILSGGEYAAICLIDAISRHLPGTLGNKDSYLKDTFSNGLLKEDVYAKPEIFDSNKVPEVLLSGNHEKIKAWKSEMSLLKTFKKRPDLLKKIKLTKKQKKLLEEWSSKAIL
jgi:tRNA (guanine37-N1)-methyltransferase